MALNKEHLSIHRRTERQLGRGVSEAAWEFAIEQHVVAEALDPQYEDGEDGLVRFLSGLLQVEDRDLRSRARRSAISRAPSDRAALVRRIEAISRLAAEAAAGDAEILRFRKFVLGRDTPMTRSEAEAYLDFDGARQPAVMSPEHGTHTEVLDYANGHVAHTLHVWPGSALDKLRVLANGLAQSYPWEPAQAAAFVLEGVVPLATPFMLRFPQTWRDDRPHRARVVMEVDLWTPAAEVLGAYREAQRRVLPGHNRPISPRSVDLVNFAMEHRSGTWPERLRAWNNEHPKDTFPDFRRMRTAFERARRALLTRSYRPYFGNDL